LRLTSASQHSLIDVNELVRDVLRQTAEIEERRTQSERDRLEAIAATERERAAVAAAAEEQRIRAAAEIEKERLAATAAAEKEQFEAMREKERESGDEGGQGMFDCALPVVGADMGEKLASARRR